MNDNYMKTPPTSLSVKWRCPSNIALVKYWGKYGHQLPSNTSVSMTLSRSHTETQISLSPKTVDEAIALDYYFEGVAHPVFAERIKRYLNQSTAFPFLNDCAVTIHSSNSFPHSAGIASSASAFGSIALGMLDIEYALNGKTVDANFYREASDLARQGSGSAARSLFPGYAVWGEHSAIADSSNRAAAPLPTVHPVFRALRDAVLIVDDAPKTTSSSAGHHLMREHPYADNRFQQANNRSALLVQLLEKGDMPAFIRLCESEALTLHAMMMTSSDYYLLMKPNTIAIIEKMTQWRENKKVPVCFTLDAGSTVHLLYPEEAASSVEDFIEGELRHLCKSIIFDRLGNGPVKLSS